MGNNNMGGMASQESGGKLWLHGRKGRQGVQGRHCPDAGSREGPQGRGRQRTGAAGAVNRAAENGNRAGPDKTWPRMHKGGPMAPLFSAAAGKCRAGARGKTNKTSTDGAQERAKWRDNPAKLGVGNT